MGTAERTEYPLVDLAGTSREMGLAHGRQLRDRIRANRGTQPLYGHTPSALIGQQIGNLSHPQAPAPDRLDRLAQVFPDKKKVPTHLEFIDIDGRQVRMRDFKGKNLILNFWGEWCKPCMEEIPHSRDT